jgi:hypothetical protein
LTNFPLKTLACLSATFLSVSLLAQAANASAVVNRVQPAQSATRGMSVADQHHWKPYFVTKPATNIDRASLQFQAAAGNTLPFFSDSVLSPLDNHTYNYQILGTNPKSSLTSTIIHYIPIMLRVHFPDGTVLDPTKPGCNDTKSVRLRFFTGPLFRNVPLTSNGINVGTTQIVDGFQRAEFWSLTQGSGYHVLLRAAAKVRIVDYNAPSGSVTTAGACAGSGHNLGVINPNSYDSELQTLTNQYATTNQLPIIAAYNVVLGYGLSNCCIIGYHSAYPRTGGTQVYATGAYTDAGIFSGGLADIHAWTHELGEAFNDPFVNNGTPAWGHVGQVSGCQNNLEVGDPLTGTPFIVNFHGFTYHPQEMAYFDWFFRTPSGGTGGKYSFEGTFASAQGACH